MLSNYQKIETKNYLQNDTPNDIHVFMDMQNTFLANYAEENDINNIDNDINMSEAFDEGGIGTGLALFSEIDFGFGEMGIDPTFFNAIDLADDMDDGEMGTASVLLGNEAVADGAEDSFDTTNDPSSEVNGDGCSRAGHRWCCKRWYEIKTGSLSKHLKTHNPDKPCLASPKYCKRKFPTKKELYKHYRAEHRDWANRNDIPDTSCSCEACGKDFTRPDNLARHLKNCPKTNR
ncbi:hypothetical protein HDV64DRAFT_287677 [Trichoderma sp. TUCIM 5745]